MSRYNLIDEKWIPVRFPDGTRDELGIRDTLLRSKDIAEIEDGSPLVVAALHRFLLAILYRALEGPTDIEQAKTLFREGLPPDKITAYLEKWRDRFWLFDDKYPFYQVPGYEPKEWRQWPTLAAEHNADNAKVLFDHVGMSRMDAIPAGKAARWLLGCQNFSLGGGNSEFRYTKAAPSAKGAIVLPIGGNLQDTLLFSLLPQNHDVATVDSPVWETEPESVESLKQGVERPTIGFSNLYTWRARSIRLKEYEESCRVMRVAFASGVTTSSVPRDPMIAYRIVDKRGMLPVQFRDRGIWRDFDSLLPDSSELAPQVVDHARVLAKRENDRFPRTILVVGTSSDQAKINFWRMECFALPEALAGERFVRQEIRNLLSHAEDAHQSLRSACYTFARHLLSRGERKPDNKDIRGFIDQLPVYAWFWSTMEFRFHEILPKFSIDYDSEEIRCEWLHHVRDALHMAWEKQNVQVSSGDTWAIRALVKAEGIVRGRIKELTDMIDDLQPLKEEE